jgi:uncharacterized protein YecE (DUF72 family)
VGEELMGGIFTGTCSWTEKTLITSGEFYPAGTGSPEGRLRYYASRFSTVEVDSTYYAIPPVRSAELWAQRTPEGFKFHIKVYGALTGHAVSPKTLPPELRGLLPDRDRGKESISIREPSLLKAVADAMAGSLAPLRESGKLGLLVFQFPPWFTYKAGSLDYILSCREMMGDMRVAVEFRHGSWLADENATDVRPFHCAFRAGGDDRHRVHQAARKEQDELAEEGDRDVAEVLLPLLGHRAVRICRDCN